MTQGYSDDRGFIMLSNDNVFNGKTEKDRYKNICCDAELAIKGLSAHANVIRISHTRPLPKLKTENVEYEKLLQDVDRRS